MAIENRVFLRGVIDDIYWDKKNGQYVIALRTIRRPYIAPGNTDGTLKIDTVKVWLREEKYVTAFQEARVMRGDGMFIYGTFNTKNGPKRFECPNCKEWVLQPMAVHTFVEPLAIDFSEITPRYYEDISLTKEQRYMEKDDLMMYLKSKKEHAGEIIRVGEAYPVGDTGNYNIPICVREKVDNKKLAEWLRNWSEISNHIFVMGHLVKDPDFYPEKGQVCHYQLAINRKVTREKDTPDVRTDYPHIISLGEQAFKDYTALKQGSLVYIDGSIQSRSHFARNIKCPHCHLEGKVRDETMEIIPYSVEYLRNFVQLGKNEDDTDMEMDTEEASVEQSAVDEDMDMQLPDDD